MMDERELRSRFAQLREADQESAPGFAQTYGHARERRSRRTTLLLRPLVLSAAAVIAMAAIGLAYARSLSPSAATPEIATWRAPTDVFLTSPGIELLGSMPTLGASVLDEMIPTHSIRGT